MEIVLLIGVAPLALDEASAMWLEETVRQRWSDDTGRPLDSDLLDADGCECMLLAEVIGDNMARGLSPEPIELGNTHMAALEQLLRDEIPNGNPHLTHFAEVLRRYNA